MKNLNFVKRIIEIPLPLHPKEERKERKSFLFALRQNRWKYCNTAFRSVLFRISNGGIGTGSTAVELTHHVE